MALRDVLCLTFTLAVTKVILCQDGLPFQARGRMNETELPLTSSLKFETVDVGSLLTNKEHLQRQSDSFSGNNESTDALDVLQDSGVSRDELSQERLTMANDGLALIGANSVTFNTTESVHVPFLESENSTEDDLTIHLINIDTYQITKTYSTVYSWNKTHISARDYQQSYCPYRCKDGEIVYVNNIDLQCPVIHCTDCQCARPYCSYYGICCPDISEPYFPPPQLISGVFTMDDYFGAKNTLIDRPTDIPGYDTVNYTSYIGGAVNTSVVLGCDDTSTTYSFFYVRSCSADFSGDDETVRLCEQDIPLDDMTIDVVTRVADIVTSVIYRNKFCALCNALNQTVDFQIRIKCENYMKVYMANNPEELFRLVMKWNSGCGVHQFTPEMIRYVPCNAALFREDVISSCPAAAHWQYDEDVERACSSLTHPMYGVFRNMWGPYYKNIFCAMCNLNSYPTYGHCEQSESNSPPQRAYLPFSLLINFRRPSSDDTVNQLPKSIFTRENCSRQEWPTPNGPCVQLRCSEGKLIDKDGCSTALTSVSGLGYTVRVWLVPQLRGNDLITEILRYLPLNLIMENIKLSFQQLFEDLSDGHLTEIGLLTTDASNSSFSYNLTAPFIIWVQSSFVGKFSSPRDDFENTLIHTFMENPIAIDVLKGYSVMFKQHVMIGAFESSSICNQISQDNATCITETLASDNLWQKRQKGMMKLKDLFLNVSLLLTCRFVSFNTTQFKINMDHFDIPPRVNVMIDLNGIVINISDATDLKMINMDGEGRLNVCHELLEDKLSELEEANRRALLGQPEVASASEEAQYILTLTCLGMSMLCLVLTLFTYFRFRVLQSSAGLNNIFLCTSLLLAQAMLCLASHLSGPSHSCTAVGMLTHFSWLWMFTWTFICCFHMFRVFTAKTRRSCSTSRGHTAELIKKLFSSLVFPVLVVTAVVVSSVMTSPDQNSGYGHVTCYLNSTLLIGLSVVAPLAVVLVCNAVFFTIVVVHIERVRKLKSSDAFKKEDRQNLCVYLKLSSVTGAFWVMAIMAEALESDALRFISILLNGLQGAFIFLSYVCNKRVLHLYVPRLRGDTKSFRRSTQLSHTSHTETTSVDSPQSFRGAADKVKVLKHALRPTTSADHRNDG